MKISIKSLFWNVYWAIIGILSAILFLLSKNPLLVLIPLIVLIAISIYVGNIFVVKTIWRGKPIIMILIIFLALFFFENLLELQNISLVINTIFTSILSISVIITVLVKESGGATISLLITNWNKFKKYFSNYLLKFNFGAVFGWIVEIGLIVGMVIVFPNSLTKILMIIFWAISGSLFVMLRGTPFTIKEPINDIMVISQIYGTSRVTYFLLIFYYGSSQMDLLGFSFLFSLMYFGFLSALMPYIIKSEELKKTIEVLKYLSANTRSKVAHISVGVNIDSKEETLDILRRLQFNRFVDTNDEKRWSLNKTYSTLIK